MESNQQSTNQNLLIVILEGAPLKIATINNEVVLVNGEDHASYIKKKLLQDPAKYRPDITHQVLLKVSFNSSRFTTE